MRKQQQSFADEIDDLILGRRVDEPCLADGPVEWPQAEVIAKPINAKRLKEPTVLVRRNILDCNLIGIDGEQLFSLPGQPTISLFTGCGGFDLGTEAAGFCTVVQHEWDESCCQTLIANRPRCFRHSALIQGDIFKTPTSLLLREGGLRVGEATLVTGGPPCQGFSLAGKRRLDDKRNDLVFEYLRVVREAQPKFFLMENVPGFLSFNKGAYLEAFLRKAYEGYYELVYGLIDAVNFGVPQHRCRFICMGTRRDLVDCDGMLGSLPRPTHFHDQHLKLIQLADTPLFPEEYDRLTHAPGIRYFPDRPVLRPPAPNNGDSVSKKYLEFYDKIEREEPDRIVRSPQGGDW